MARNIQLSINTEGVMEEIKELKELIETTNKLMQRQEELMESISSKEIKLSIKH